MPAFSQQCRELGGRKSPVRQIMDYASPAHLRSLNLDPAKVISFAGGWVSHRAPDRLREAYLELCADAAAFHDTGAYSPSLGRLEAREAIAEFERHLYGIEVGA